MKKYLRVLLVDHHDLVRMGLRALLNRYPDFDVVGEAANAIEAQKLARDYKPDIIVMEAQLSGHSGIYATREIKRLIPEIKIVILTCYADEELLFDAIDAGASAYLLKQIKSEQLVQALETVGNGYDVLDHRITHLVLHRIREAGCRLEQDIFADLTEQEMHILALVAKGKTNRKIADMLNLSYGTVRNYVSNLIKKLNVQNRAQAASIAIHHHIANHLPRNLIVT